MELRRSGGWGGQEEEVQKEDGVRERRMKSMNEEGVRLKGKQTLVGSS